MKTLNGLCLVLLCTTLSVTLSLNDGLLPNGGFERGPKPDQMKGRRIMDPHAVPNWIVSGYVEYIKSGQKYGDMLLPVPKGQYALRLGNEASITTTIRVTNGSFYSLTYVVARTCAQEEKLELGVAPSSEAPKDWGTLPMQTMYSSNGWDSFSWGFFAESDEIDVTFRHPQTDNYDFGCGPIIDSVAIKTLVLSNAREILKNGNFEEGPYVIPNTNSGVMVLPSVDDDHCPLVGWQIESMKAVRYIDSSHFAVPEGTRAVELAAGRESVIVQTVKTVVNMEYGLEFLVGDARNQCEGSMQVEVFAGGSTFQVPYESVED